MLSAAPSLVAPELVRSGPPATSTSVGMLLAHLGRTAEAERVEAAVAADLAERGAAPRPTHVVGDAIAARL